MHSENGMESLLILRICFGFATTILTETTLDQQLRFDGSQVLLYHDLLEDTTRQLPDWLFPHVKNLIEQMSSAAWAVVGGSKIEAKEIWS